MKRFILFGAGENGRKAIEFWGHDRVEYFVDNNKQRVGEMFCGKRIISIDELSEIWQSYDIMITANCYGEMAEQLKGMGIYEYSKFMIPNTNKLLLYLNNINWEKYSGIALYGSDEYALALLKNVPDKIGSKIKCVLDDRNSIANFKCAEYVIHRTNEIDLKYDAVLITSPLYHIADENHLQRVMGENIDILNPYKMDKYYSTKELVVNKYIDESNEAMNEEKLNKKNRNRTDYFSAVKEYVHEVKDETPLFKLVEIETINRCNGVCEFCPVNIHDDPREKHIMSEELFYNIVGQLEQLNYKDRISLFSNNEPFLDKRILEFSKYMREHLPNAKIHMFTNGTLLTLEKFITIVKYVDELIIDNYTQDLRLIKPAEDIKAYCEEHPELIEKVSIVLRKPKEILTSRGGMAPNRKEQEEYPDVTCAFPFQQLIIRPTGQVSLCCNDALGKYTLGDLTKESILDVWYGEKYKNVRRAIAEGRKNVDICKTCDTFSLYL